jgi:hypothetical protein
MKMALKSKQKKIEMKKYKIKLKKRNIRRRKIGMKLFRINSNKKRKMKFERIIAKRAELKKIANQNILKDTLYFFSNISSNWTNVISNQNISLKDSMKIWNELTKIQHKNKHGYFNKSKRLKRKRCKSVTKRQSTTIENYNLKIKPPAKTMSNRNSDSSDYTKSTKKENSNLLSNFSVYSHETRDKNLSLKF